MFGCLTRRDRLPLAAEAFALRPVVGDGEADQLEGDEAVEAQLPGLPHDAHAAAAQPRQQLITGEAARRLGRLAFRSERLRLRASRGHPGRLQRDQPGRRGQALALGVEGRRGLRQVPPQLGHHGVVVAERVEGGGAGGADGEVVGDGLQPGRRQPAALERPQRFRPRTAVPSRRGGRTHDAPSQPDHHRSTKSVNSSRSRRSTRPRAR